MIKENMSFQIHTWFPTAIYVAEDIVEHSYNEDLKNFSEEIFGRSESGAHTWNCNTKNTMGSHNVIEDPRFDTLTNSINKHLKTFLEYHNSNHDYGCNDGWLNINYKNSYQEYHCHANSTFSAVYYIATPPGSGRIIFQNPTEPDMLPVKGIVEENDLTFKQSFYSPQERTLLIFRSNIRHMVEIGTNDEPRITAAFNF
jgi:uncharacterized protein (TIGR02466 family)